MNDTDQAFVIQLEDLQALLEAVRQQGYTPIGPQLHDGVIVYDELQHVDDLPKGWTDDQEAGQYRVKKRDDDALFGFNNGPHSWKKYLFPPRTKLWSAKRTEDAGFAIEEEQDKAGPFAFIGVRACDLHAIEVQDKVFMSEQHQDPIYTARRKAALIVAVNCGQAAKTCFCTSMQTGPKATSGYDLALTELVEGEKHRFVVEAGSDKGRALLQTVAHTQASRDDLAAAKDCTNKAEAEMGRKIDISDIKDLLYRNYDNARWAELEKRCLACGNCTMSCPTCFCSRVEDVTDLSGDHAERWREWDSCFTVDFSYIHGGSIRPSTRSRYRQWLMHKLATWMDQFGSSGCVGCGRCITWCPVGIDLTEEVREIRNSEKEAVNG